MVDQIVRGTESLSSDPRVFHDTSIGGKAFNIAAAAARFGAEVELITAVGNDAEATRALEKIRDLGIGSSYVRHCGARGGRVVGTPIQWTFPVTEAEGSDIKTPRVRLTEGRYGEREVQLVQDAGISDYYRAAIAAIEPKEFDVIIFTWSSRTACCMNSAT
ncbi:MAG: PfkB family carbohydrate kinase [Actinomycetota bacterium]|nr:PfkB family carbohydrate kinase [Actinomycetota bacterium]